MIKATVEGKDGHHLLIVGLSFANLNRLREDGLDGFIKIVGKEIGLPVDVMITAGETEAVMAEFFEKYIGPETQVHVSERLKS